jgi:hypothetical protein
MRATESGYDPYNSTDPVDSGPLPWEPQHTFTGLSLTPCTRRAPQSKPSDGHLLSLSSTFLERAAQIQRQIGAPSRLAETQELIDLAALVAWLGSSAPVLKD